MLWFRNIPVAKRFMDKRGGEYQDFPSKIFCLTVPRNFVGEPFRVSLIRVSKSFYFRGLFHDFRFYVEFFLSHIAEKFRRGTLPFCVSEDFRQPKNLWIRRRGVSRFSVGNYLSHSA